MSLLQKDEVCIPCNQHSDREDILSLSPYFIELLGTEEKISNLLKVQQEEKEKKVSIESADDWHINGIQQIFHLHSLGIS